MAKCSQSEPHNFSRGKQKQRKPPQQEPHNWKKSARVKGFNQPSIQQWQTTTSVVVSAVAVDVVVIAAEAVVVTVDGAVANAKVGLPGYLIINCMV